MQKLLEFLIAKRHWLLFILLEIISFIIIFKNNAYQQNLMFSSANIVTGKLSSSVNAVSSYFDLRKVNQSLLENNARLEMEILNLKEQMGKNVVDTLSVNDIFLTDSAMVDSLAPVGFHSYKYMTSEVVNNSIKYMNNYITINKGSKDGIRPDMGVVSSYGVAGIVLSVKSRYSVVIPIHNTKLRISCKVKGKHYFGALTWDGKDPKYANLEGLPTHAEFEKGDTVVTSGYSAVFPENMMVGIVESYKKQNDDNFYSLKVDLATNFYSLKYLYVIENNNQKEQKEIEMEVKAND